MNASSEHAQSRFILAIVSALVLLATAAFHHEVIHWFVLPTLICGILIGTDAMQWFRGKTDLFDPVALVSLLGYHFFFIAPLLMVVLDWRMKYLPDQPLDYRNWLGGMACLNVLGIVTYQVVRHRVTLRMMRRPGGPRKEAVWQVNSHQFWIYLTIFLIGSMCCQTYIYISFGGISGYIDSYTAALSGNDLFAGSSLLFAVAESLPILLAIGFAMWAHKRKVSFGTILAVIGVLAVLDFMSGGLRGSRSNVIWTLFWIVGIFHNYVRRLPRTLAYAGVIALYLFVSVYAAYKEHGGGLFETFVSAGDYSALNDNSEGPATVLVGDFSRTDVQAYLFYKQWSDVGQQPALGATYLGALTMLVPRSLWPDRPPTIVKWTTDAEYGTGAYSGGAMLSSRVYGIAGEAMLNFGLLGCLIAYAFLGACVGAFEVFVSRIRQGDLRLLVLPFVTNLFFVVLLNDSDNAFFYLIKYGLVPVVLVVLGSRRRQSARRGQRPATAKALWRGTEAALTSGR